MAVKSGVSVMVMMKVNGYEVEGNILSASFGGSNEKDKKYQLEIMIVNCALKEITKEERGKEVSF